MGKVTYGDFNFPKDFGFTGSAAGRADARPHRDAGPDEYGDKLAASGPKAKGMAKGGVVKKQMGGMLAHPMARAAAVQAASAPKAAVFAPNPTVPQPGQPPRGPQPANLQPAKLGVSPALINPATGVRPAPQFGPAPLSRAPLSRGPMHGMKDGGQFIKDAVKKPGRMKRYAKKLGVGLGEAISKAKHSNDPSLRAAGNLGARFRSGEFKK